MFDDIIAQNVPDGGDWYAGYDDGHWPDADSLQQRFPNKRILRVTVNPQDIVGDVLDVEQGDARPEDLPGWLVRRRAISPGQLFWGYCSLSLWQACRDQLRLASVREPLWWIAHYDNDPTIPVGAQAKQYQSTGDYDISSVLDWIPRFDLEHGAWWL